MANTRFVTFGYLFQSWLCKVVPGWLSALKISQTDSTKATVDDDDDLDPALKTTQEYAKITGKRARKTQQFIESLEGTLGMKLTVLSIVDEPLRSLTFYFMSCNDVANQKPVLINLTNEQRSPLTACTQYLSSLLFCAHGRTLLVWKKQGFSSVEDWERLQPSQVRLFRRLVLLACAWIQRRHCDRFLQFPFSFCLLADEGASEQRKQDLLAQWDSCFACCVRPGMARTLKKRGISSEQLMTNRFLSFCFLES